MNVEELLTKSAQTVEAIAEQQRAFNTRLADMESKAAVVRGKGEAKPSITKMISEHAGFKSVEWRGEKRS